MANFEIRNLTQAPVTNTDVFVKSAEDGSLTKTTANQIVNGANDFTTLKNSVETINNSFGIFRFSDSNMSHAGYVCFDMHTYNIKLTTRIYNEINRDSVLPTFDIPDYLPTDVTGFAGAQVPVFFYDPNNASKGYQVGIFTFTEREKGSRKQGFAVDNMTVIPAGSYIFINSFGVLR